MELSADPSVVNAIIRHPKVYPHVSDDYSPPAESFDCASLLAMPGVWFLLCEHGGFLVHAHTRSVCEIHTCLLPPIWGRARELGAEAVRFVFAELPCEKLITWVPENNRLARKLALDVGMREEGFSPKSWRKGGRMLGRYLFGVEPCLSPP